MPKSADDCRLSRKQERAILELLNPSNRTQLEIARKVGISERTLRYWQSLPHFQKRLEKEREKLLNEGINNLRASFNLGVLSLRKLMFDSEPSIRLKATLATIEYGFKILERDKEKQLENPYYESYDDVKEEGEGSRVMSIYEKLNRLKEITAGNLQKVRDEIEAKEKEKSGGDEIKLKDP